MPQFLKTRLNMQGLARLAQFKTNMMADEKFGRWVRAVQVFKFNTAVKKDRCVVGGLLGVAWGGWF